MNETPSQYFLLLDGRDAGKKELSTSVNGAKGYRADAERGKAVAVPFIDYGVNYRNGCPFS